MMREKIINLFIGIFGLLIIAGCSSIGYYYYSLSKDSDEFERLREKVTITNDFSGKADKEALPDTALDEKKQNMQPKIQPDIQIKELYAENQDIAGWIIISGTQIDYPIMYTPKDPEYYLHRNFQKEYSSSGIPFVDGNCSISPMSENLIIYGHHMKNGSMFADLLSYKSESYWKEHSKIEIQFLSEKKEYEIIAAFEVDVEKEQEIERIFKIGFGNEEEFNAYIDFLRECSFYDTGFTAEYGENLVTLCTCSYHAEDGRFVVVARE